MCNKPEIWMMLTLLQRRRLRCLGQSCWKKPGKFGPTLRRCQLSRAKRWEPCQRCWHLLASRQRCCSVPRNGRVSNTICLLYFLYALSWLHGKWPLFVGSRSFLCTFIVSVFAREKGFWQGKAKTLRVLPLGSTSPQVFQQIVDKRRFRLPSRRWKSHQNLQ